MFLHNEFARIMEAELKMNPKDLDPKLLPVLTDPVYFQAAAEDILAIVKNGTILRMGAKLGHLTSDDIAFESDGSHVNVFTELVDSSINFCLGHHVNFVDKYTRSEIYKAIRIHDLMENDTGDYSDNHKGIDQYQQKLERDFFKEYLDATVIPSRPCEKNSYIAQFYKEHVYELLVAMQSTSPGLGALLKVADKGSAVLSMLAYDSIAYGTTKYNLLPHCPYMTAEDPGASELNQKQMKLCDTIYNAGYLLSEMWTIDFFHSRNFAQYDETGFITATIVMATLLVHHKWYKWRYQQYEDANL